MRITDFNNDLGYSRNAVAVVTKWLRSTYGDIASVTDVACDRISQMQGIDLVLNLKDGQTQTIEVKSDRCHKTGNYFFEIVSNLQLANIGCILKCQADCIFYYFDDVRELHIFNTKDIVTWFIANIDTFKTRKVATKCAGGSYTSLGCLVPRNQVPHDLVTIKRLG